MNKEVNVSNEDNRCPVTGRTSNPIAGGGMSNRDWWPNS